MKITQFIGIMLLGVSAGVFAEANIKMTKTGMATVPAPASGDVYATFTSSPRLTALLQEDLVQRGYRLAATKEEASIVIELAGMYSFQRTRERSVRLDFGQVFEEAAKEKAIQAQAGTGELSRMTIGETALVSGINVGLFSLGAINSTGLGVGLIDAISNAAGIKGGFNKMVAGDARGFCLIGCDNWHKYAQVLTVGGSVQYQGAPQKIMIEAKFSDEKLVPDMMFDSASRELMQQLFKDTARSDQEAP